MDAKLDEAALLASLRQRDETAFTQLVDQYQPSLVRLARLFVQDERVAEELSQETWIAVLQGLDHFEGRSSLKTWIFTILTNKARTRGRRENRSFVFSDFEEADSGLPVVPPERFRVPRPAPQRAIGRWSLLPGRTSRKRRSSRARPCSSSAGRSMNCPTTSGLSSRCAILRSYLRKKFVIFWGFRRQIRECFFTVPAPGCARHWKTICSRSVNGSRNDMSRAGRAGHRVSGGDIARRRTDAHGEAFIRLRWLHPLPRANAPDHSPDGSGPRGIPHPRPA